ncbi:hypothetical protein GGR56DRAFT_629121 [Xylariaceae sp. FL0804]|nr:hypothetical protein GGR56DRAFT_629121 [Xylariaceae sp. FL0804]
MRFQLPAVLLGLAASTVSAQQNQTGPFYLHIEGTSNKSINGYAASCHTGAAQEGLCYTAGSSLPTGNAESYQYYFNYSSYSYGGSGGSSPVVGELVWNLPVTFGNGTQNVSQAMGLEFLVNSNVAAPLFGFDYGMSVGFDEDDKLFGSAYYDDATFVPGVFPESAESGDELQLYQWYLCWQYFTGYYYQSIGWTTAGEPHNPTCEAVSITKVDC